MARLIGDCRVRLAAACLRLFSGAAALLCGGVCHVRKMGDLC